MLALAKPTGAAAVLVIGLLATALPAGDARPDATSAEAVAAEVDRPPMG